MKRNPKLPHSFHLTHRKLALLVAAALAGAGSPEALCAIESNVSIASIGIPITFERNDGQYPADVLFVSRGVKGTLAVRSGEVAIVPRGDAPTRGEALRLRLRGANLAPELEPLHALATRSHHYIGSSRIENVPHFGELELKDVYPGIDMVLHGRDGALEYDLVVAPGADPRDIRIDLRDAESVALDEAGNLRLARGEQTLTQHAPIAYQGEGGERHAVPASFELVEGMEGPEARIRLGAYDPSQALVVDPVIGYSTYVGSSGADGGTILRADGFGDLYFTQLGASGSVDAVVITKLDPATNTIAYQTSFGGHGFNTANGIALGGAAGTTVYVAGTTRALDFPVTPVKPDATSDAFVAVLAPSGTLTATRLIGGSGSDAGNAIVLDGAGSVFVAGTTTSFDLGVTTGPSRLNLGASASPFPGFVVSDGFVAKLDATTLATTYLRYVGGSGDDSIKSLAVDDTGHAIVAGSTATGGVPQVNAGAPTSPPPLPFQGRGYVQKLSTDGASYVYSEYIGGTSFTADVVAFDPTTGDAIVGGLISNNGLVPASATPFHGGFDAYLVRVDAVGTPTSATYLGGSGNDVLNALAVDTAGNVYATGETRSRDFPVVAGLAGMTPPLLGTSNAFVTRYAAGVIDFSSYLGGSGNDRGTAVEIARDGTVYIGGFTESVDFPTVNPLRATRSGPSDGFITGIDGLAARTPGPPFGGPPGGGNPFGGPPHGPPFGGPPRGR